MLVSWAVLLCLFRSSRANVRPSDWLLIAVFTWALWYRIRMSVWYAYVFGYVIAPHIADLVERRWPRESGPPQIVKSLLGRTFIHTLACGLLVWVGFALSPSFGLIVGRPARTPARVHHQKTPLGVTEFLRDHPPAGQVLNPQWWGDWMVASGPEGAQAVCHDKFHPCRSQACVGRLSPNVAGRLQLGAWLG